MPDRPLWASSAGHGAGGVGRSGLCHRQCRGSLAVPWGGSGKGAWNSGMRAAWWQQRGWLRGGQGHRQHVELPALLCAQWPAHACAPSNALSPCQPHTTSAMLTPLLSTHGGPFCPVPPVSGVSRCWKLWHHWQSRVPCSRSVRHHSPLSSRDATCCLPPTPSALCHLPPAPPPASPAWPSPALGSQGLVGAACTAVAPWAPPSGLTPPRWISALMSCP